MLGLLWRHDIDRFAIETVGHRRLQECYDLLPAGPTSPEDWRTCRRAIVRSGLGNLPRTVIARLAASILASVVSTLPLKDLARIGTELALHGKAGLEPRVILLRDGEIDVDRINALQPDERVPAATYLPTSILRIPSRPSHGA